MGSSVFYSVIFQILDVEVLLETADGTIVSLPASNISENLANTLKDSPVTLNDIFTVGQMIAFKVVKAIPSSGSFWKDILFLNV